MRKFWRNRNQECAADGQGRRWFRLKEKEEEGQGLVEAAVSFIFLLAIFIAMFEFVMVFTSYLGLLNTAVQGSIYSAGKIDSSGNLQMEVCDFCDAATSTVECCNYRRYVSIMVDEAQAGGLSYIDLGIGLPQLPSSPAPGEAITVTLEYTLTTFASEIVFPLFGRFGLPDEFHLRVRHAAPIR